MTANLYVPEPVRDSMPGILICHSHHRPKIQGELQDMGMTWAREGAYVLVPDKVSYGERRHQPFPGRQEYYFRYYLGMQLHVAGESLIGRIVWDLWRGVDVLLQQSEIDKDKIILLGAVAGGGDPAAVAAALDERITCAAPFNFGGPQPETPVDKKEDAISFRYTGSGGWESTRNLRLSACDGYLPWVIVAGIAPRALSYAHEFDWNAEMDPVWSRLKRIYELYGKPDCLSSVKGKGRVTLRPPEATHCNQIGPPHRAQIYPFLKSLFDMPVPEAEYQERHEEEELHCLTNEIEMTPVHELARQAAEQAIAGARAELKGLSVEEQRTSLREKYSKVLALPEPIQPTAREVGREEFNDGASCRRYILETEPGIEVPAALLLPKEAANAPVVVGVTQEGKATFLKECAEEISVLLNQGVAVCLPDLRGCGETAPNDDRSWWGPATNNSSSELMLGRTQLGNKLYDLLCVLKHLESLEGLDASRLALWGDSFAAVNPPNFEDPPLRTDPQALIGEPLGGLAALLGALYNDRVKAVIARRTLATWLSLYETTFVHLPHDIIVPGIVEAGDVCDLAGALAPTSVVLTDFVDGRNLAVSAEVATGAFASIDVGEALGVEDQLDSGVGEILAKALLVQS